MEKKEIFVKTDNEMSKTRLIIKDNGFTEDGKRKTNFEYSDFLEKKTAYVFDMEELKEFLRDYSNSAKYMITIDEFLNSKLK